MNVLFVCTSNKDRSPALVEYFKATYPTHEYRSAGLNKYLCCKKHLTHYLSADDIEWADIVVFCEKIHVEVYHRDFTTSPYIEVTDEREDSYGVLTSRTGEGTGKRWMVLDAGQYQAGTALADDFVLKVDFKVKRFIDINK